MNPKQWEHSVVSSRYLTAWIFRFIPTLFFLSLRSTQPTLVKLLFGPTILNVYWYYTGRGGEFRKKNISLQFSFFFTLFSFLFSLSLSLSLFRTTKPATYKSILVQVYEHNRYKHLRKQRDRLITRGIDQN